MPSPTFPVSTLFGLLVLGHRYYTEKTAFTYRIGDDVLKVTYEKFFEDVLLLSRAFKGKKINKGAKVLLLSGNQYAWIVTDMALMSLGAISVPRGSDTPTDELEYIVRHADCEFLIFETEALYRQHLELVRNLAHIKGVFIIGGGPLHNLFGKVHSYSEILKDRTITPEDMDHFLALEEHIDPDDILTLIYTSGTTGTPKGVVLTHRNICHNIRVLPDQIRLRGDDLWLSILPSWHIFERTSEYISLARGSSIVYSTLRTFAADLEEYRPTMVATVPRIWASIYAKVQAGLKKQNPKKLKLFNLLVKISALFRYHSRFLRKHLPRFEKIGRLREIWLNIRSIFMVFVLFPFYLLASNRLSVVRKKLGGRLRVAISGGGTLPPYLEEWLDAVGITITNAYGMTECSPGIAGRGLQCQIIGTLGPPFPETELRIVDEQGEILPPGREGEVQVKGEQVTPGYYNDEEANQAAFTEDGFFRTGDLGKMTISGELVLTGRAKEIIVLSSGENINPNRIEEALGMFPFVDDAALVGQDKKGLGALIVPNMEKLKEYVLEKFGIPSHTEEHLFNNEELHEKIRKEINKKLEPGKGFKPYERLHKITFLKQEFRLGEELTNTLKKKRHVIENKYRELINKLLK
jgi:long-chain acyl-CoA synthetase